jgi:hypothetical protein
MGKAVQQSKSEQPDRDPEELDEELDERTRYRIIEHEDESEVIVCGNSPNIELHIERGLTVDSRTRKRYPAQTIFLDGVYDGAPFYDNEARHYSLDHHSGCVRAFTLATCEQAVVMLLQGLPLSVGTWHVYVNDPDLDSMLASWVILNHTELMADDRKLLARAMPLIRLEGVIDAHGTDKQVLAAFPVRMHAKTKAQLDALMAEELRIKKAGQWMEADWLEYACEVFEHVDSMVFPHGHLDALLELQEISRVPLHNHRVAVLLASQLGIYEVENRLKDRHGKSLGVIVLETGTNRYTLRLVDPFLPKDLTAVYKELNRVDPNAEATSDPPNIWGGSGDIGGSPRRTGSGLSGHEILEAIQDVLGQRRSFWQRMFGSSKKRPSTTES